MSAVDARTLLGHRILVSEVAHYRDVVAEWKLLEVSPSGLYLKFQDAYGKKFWKKTDKVTFVEKLELVAAPLPPLPPDLRHPKEGT